MQAVLDYDPAKVTGEPNQPSTIKPNPGQFIAKPYNIQFLLRKGDEYCSGGAC